MFCRIAAEALLAPAPPQEAADTGAAGWQAGSSLGAAAYLQLLVQHRAQLQQAHDLLLVAIAAVASGGGPSQRHSPQQLAALDQRQLRQVSVHMLGVYSAVPRAQGQLAAECSEQLLEAASKLQAADAAPAPRKPAGQQAQEAAGKQQGRRRQQQQQQQQQRDSSRIRRRKPSGESGNP